MNTYFFTFGSNHPTESGASLGQCYCAVSADTLMEAREKMFAARGSIWSFSYESPEEAGVERFGLREVSLNDICLSKGAHDAYFCR